MRIDLHEHSIREPEPAVCAFCDRPFEMVEMYARASAGATDCGEVCPKYVDYLSRGPMAATGNFPAFAK